MQLTVTESAKAAGVSRTTIYEKIKDGELSRINGKIDTAELLRVFGTLSGQNESEQTKTFAPVDNVLVTKLVDQLTAKDEQLALKDEKIERIETELAETEQRLAEHREASRALMSPADFESKLQEKLIAQKAEHKAALKAQQTEQARLIAEQRQLEQQKSERWEASLAQRKQEIEDARREAETLKQKAAEDISIVERRAAAERAVREALESRGLIARLLNRKPKMVEG